MYALLYTLHDEYVCSSFVNVFLCVFFFYVVVLLHIFLAAIKGALKKIQPIIMTFF